MPKKLHKIQFFVRHGTIFARSVESQTPAHHIGARARIVYSSLIRIVTAPSRISTLPPSASCPAGRRRGWISLWNSFPINNFYYTPVAHRIDNLHAKTEKEKVLYPLRIQDFLLVRVRRFELPASWTPFKHATNCATPGYFICSNNIAHRAKKCKREMRLLGRKFFVAFLYDCIRILNRQVSK